MRTQFICLALAIVLIGPLASAQWVQMAGPDGGVVQAIVGCGPDLIAGTYGSGIFRSVDNGDHWISASVGLTNPDIYCLTVCDSNVFAGTGSDVYSSTDGGRSWSRMGLWPGNVWALVTKGRDLFAATSGGGVYRSTDQGTSWSSVFWGGAQTNALATDGTRLYAGTQTNGVYLSTDDGANWSPAGLAGIWISSLAVIGNNVYAGTNAWPNKQPGGGYRSTDNGASWTNVIPAREFFGVNCFAVQGSTIFAGTSGYVKRSTDGGMQWSDVMSGFTGFDVRALAVAYGNVYAGTCSWDGGIYRSSDFGNSWEGINSGLSGVEVQALMAEGTTLLAGGDHGTYRSANHGVSWVKVNTIPSTCFAVLGSSLYAGGTGVEYSVDDGLTWNMTVGLPVADRGTCLAVKGSTLLAGILYRGIFRSIDGGAHWNTANAGLSDTMFVLSMAANGQYVFAGGGNGISRSLDDGFSWYPSSSGLPSDAVYALAVKGTKIFAGTWGDGVYRSTDDGATWVPANGTLTDSTDTTAVNARPVIVLSLAVVGTNLFAGTENTGVLLTTDDGATWSDVSNGMLKSRIHAIASDGTNAYVCAVSGIWVRPLSEMVTASPANGGISVPTSLSLYQNFPNPFNPGTTIRFDLPQPTNVWLRVYDMLGREVSVLVNEKREAGVHEVKFDGSNLASGVYFYRIQAGNFVATKKLLLLR